MGYWLKYLLSLREKCPYSEFFWPEFSRIRAEFPVSGSVYRWFKFQLYES